MSSRSMVKYIISGTPRRRAPIFTTDPLGPRRRFMTSACGIFTPEINVSLAVMILSPASMPTFSEGPPTTV